jgi:hypothetical protein
MTRAHESNNRPQLVIVGPSMPERTLAYLATPYTNYEKGIEWAFREASRIAGELLLAGVEVYCPMAHCHPLSIHAQIDALDRDFWLRYQEAFMARCDVLIVAQMQGWKESHGINHEINFFLTRKRVIFMLNPDTMNMRRMTTTLGGIERERAGESA